MPRVVSFIVLLAIVLLIGSMFFQVMVQFIVPLFLAAVLVVIFKPLHLWVVEKCGYRVRIGAALTTLLIVLIVLLPILGMVVRAVFEGADLYESVNAQPARVVKPEGPPAQREQPTAEQPSAEQPVVEKEDAESAEAKEEEKEPAERAVDASAIYAVIDELIPKINGLLTKLRLPELKRDETLQYVEENLNRIAAPLALGGVKALGSTLMGLAILILSLYYFLADGPSMVAGLMKLSPLDDKYEQELLDKFSDISRSVVVAVLLSAIVQGVLAGFGYWLAGVENVFFLTVATCFLAMVPFVGAAAVWVPVCAVLYFYHEDSQVAAVVLAVYCTLVVSMIDNLIKPLVLHGQANLHPLLALLSVIGGIQALGPIGILVGPMLVAFLQALLNMLNKELHLLGKESDETGKPVVFATDAATKGASAAKSANDGPKSATPLPKPPKQGRKGK